jgi:hypothetical protein
MENGNLREYIRGHRDADRMRLLSQVASGAHTTWFCLSDPY